MSDALAVHVDAVFEIETAIDDFHTGLLDHRIKHRLGDLGFEGGGEFGFRVERGHALTLIFESLAFLVSPCFGFLVVKVELVVVFARQAAEDGVVADVGPAEAAAGEAAEVAVLGNEDGGFAHARGLHCGDDTAGGVSIDDDVGFMHIGGDGGD